MIANYKFDELVACIKRACAPLSEYLYDGILTTYETYQRIQHSRRRAALQRARDITWMKGNKHIWNPKPTKRSKPC